MQTQAEPFSAGQLFHLQIQFVFTGFAKAKPLIKMRCGIVFKDLQAKRDTFFATLGNQIAQQPAADAVAPVLGKQGDIHKGGWAGSAVDDHPSDRRLAKHGYLFFSFRVSSCIPAPLGVELHLQERFLLCLVPAKWGEFRQAGAGIEFEQECTIVIAGRPK